MNYKKIDLIESSIGQKIKSMAKSLTSELLSSFEEMLYDGNDEVIASFIKEHTEELKKEVLDDGYITGVSVVHLPTAELFMEWGVDPLKGWEKGRDGNSMLYTALDAGEIVSFELIMKRVRDKVEVADLFRVADNGSATMFFYLMDKYPDHKVDMQKKLHDVIRGEEVGLILEAIKRGAVVNRKFLADALSDSEVDDEMIEILIRRLKM